MPCTPELLDELNMLIRFDLGLINKASRLTPIRPMPR